MTVWCTVGGRLRALVVRPLAFHTFLAKPPKPQVETAATLWVAQEACVAADPPATPPGS